MSVSIIMTENRNTEAVGFDVRTEEGETATANERELALAIVDLLFKDVERAGAQVSVNNGCVGEREVMGDE